MKRALILASGSERRKMLLEALGFELTLKITDVPETIDCNETAEANALRIAKDKLRCAHLEIGEQNLPIVCADTIVVCDGMIFGKPSSTTNAEEMLTALSGKKHEVITAFAVQCGANIKTGVVITAVHFRDLSADEIKSYVKTNHVLDKSGSYAIQGSGAGLVDCMFGSVSNVIGLPVKEVLQAIDETRQRT
jgi:septum formation protein